MPDFALEQALAARHGTPIVGIDEAGRGPWAGPVVAAAVALDPDKIPAKLLSRLDDSKKLAKPAREALFDQLHEAGKDVAIAVGHATVDEIDSFNILQATFTAMTRAVAALPSPPAAALVDGNRLPDLPCPAEAVIKGDGRSLSIAAASIIAKVTRDRMMADLAKRFPGYGWERNQGYGTAEHRAAIAEMGVTPAHRQSFRPVREAKAITL